MKKKILIIGGVPEPIGGVTTHVWRLVNALKNTYNVSLLDVFPSEMKYPVDGFNVLFAKGNIHKVWLLIREILFGRYDVIHIHQSTVRNIAKVFPLLFRKKKLVVTFHHGTLLDGFETLSKFQKWMTLRILKNVRGFVILSESQKQFYEKMNLLTSVNYTETSSFLFPSDFEIKSSFEKNTHDEIVISVSGSIKQEYRIVEAIDVFDKLKLKYKNLVLHIFTYGNIDDLNYEKMFYQKIHDRDDINHYKNLNNQEFLGNLKQSDLFLRPFNNDSCGLVVYEAIGFGIPAVATNCCPRSPGTILYQTDNFEELYQRAEFVIANLDSQKEKLKHIKLEDSLEDIIKLY